MKRSAQKALVIVIAVIFVFVLIAGCQEENLSNTKKSRLIATENAHLKKQLDKRDIEIRNLSQQHEKESQEQQKRLAECLNQRNVLQREMGKNISEQVDSVLKVVLEQNVELREENTKLKAQLEQLTK